jgi:predicted phage terminase large subunit-like protein
VHVPAVAHGPAPGEVPGSDHIISPQIISIQARLDELRTQYAELRLYHFVEQAWPVLEKNEPFVGGWHIGCVCEHLEAITYEQIYELLINMPPGTMKSYLFSVFWPAWEWTKRPWYRYLCASHDQSLSTRDNRRVRDLIESPWYRARWPLELRDDENTKTKYDTTEGGWRLGTSVLGRGIGEHPHRKIIDDAHKPTKVPGKPERDAVWQWFTQTMGPRGQGLRAATVVGGQRLHEDDLAGRILAERPDFVKLLLAMRADPTIYHDLHIPDTTPIRTDLYPNGFKDPRPPGTLLWKKKMPRSVVDKTEKDLGSWGTAAQHQQRPIPVQGTMFQRGWFQIVHTLPSDAWMAARFWDVAGTEDGDGAQTIGVRIVKTHSNKFIITDVHGGMWGDETVDSEIKATAKADGPLTMIREEQEPGSAGKAVVRARKRALAGYDYDGVRSTGDKITRARPFRVQAEARNIFFLVPLDPDGRPNEAAMEKYNLYVAEVELFPWATRKDRMDATSGCFNFLALDETFRPSLHEGAPFPLHY